MRPLFRHPRIEFRIAGALACLLLASAGAVAHSTDREQPLQVNAGGLDGPVSQNGETVLTDVIITQGTLRIEARRASVRRSDGEVTRVVLEGAPASLQQKNDDGQLMQAQAHNIDYDTSSEIVLLTGTVQIHQGRDEFRGERVRYDTRNGRITSDGGTDGRIQLTIHPKSRAPAD